MGVERDRGWIGPFCNDCSPTSPRIDIAVVNKIDWLTRSLADFAKIVEILDMRGARLCR
jgi:DNA invertase Pin-like site-specific DNA recombinase